MLKFSNKYDLWYAKFIFYEYFSSFWKKCQTVLHSIKVKVQKYSTKNQKDEMNSLFSFIIDQREKLKFCFKKILK